MAANTTRDDGKSAGGPDTAETVAQLDDLVDLMEAIDWTEVNGIATAEAATLACRLDDARERTGGPAVATDGGRDTLAASAFDARDRLAGHYDDMTVAQAIRWGVEVDT